MKKLIALLLLLPSLALAQWPGWSNPPIGGISSGSTAAGFTAGSIPYIGTGPVLSQDNANLSYNSTAKAVVSQQFVSAPQTLTDQATVTMNLASSKAGQVTLTASRIMACPTNIVAGSEAYIYPIQGGSGSYTITWNSCFKWPSGIAPTLSTTVGAVDMVVCHSRDGTNLNCNFGGDYK